MKTILSSRKHRHVAGVIIFLIAVALVAGIAGCSQVGPPPSYSLTIASTGGGSVATHGEGTFTYEEGTVVNLVADADAGYRFANWTGGVGTIAGVNAASTTISMNGNYSITANFEQIPPEQFGLTISSTAEGSVTAPGEGAFTYDAGTEVSLVATPASGRRFANWTGNVGSLADINAASTTITMNDNYSITANFEYTPMVAAGAYHTVGLKSDGTVVAVGDNHDGKCNVGGWTDIVQIAAGVFHTVGLRSDGTAVAVGHNGSGQCNVEDWTDITQVSAGYYHTVGLKSDGTAVAVGTNKLGQSDVGGWMDIVQVAAYHYQSVGLKADGTVVAVGWNDQGQCNVDVWVLN